jgi:outer membrane receptor protein involved in Fe transport
MFPMTDFGALTVRADAAYQGEVYADPTNNITNLIDSYTLTNLLAWWESPEGDWRLEFQCLNCTDEVYYHDLYDQSGSWGAVLAQPGMPRTYNFAIQRNFN